MQKLLSDPTQLAGLNDRLRTIETMLRKDMERAAELDKAGRTAESAELKKEIRLRAEKLKLFRMQFLQAQQAHMKAQSQGQAQAQSGPSGSAKPPDAPPAQPSGAGAGTSSSVKPPEPAALAGPSTGTGTATAMDVTAKPDPGVAHARPTPVLPPAMLPGNKGLPQAASDPNIAAQMAKLIEQTTKHPPNISAQPSGPPPASPEKPQAAAPLKNPGLWQGTFTWRGFDSETHVRKDLQTQVLMASPKPDAMCVSVSLSLALLRASKTRFGCFQAWRPVAKRAGVGTVTA